MPLLQVPVVRFPIPPAIYQRQLKPGERTSYSVEGDWTGPEGPVRYEYDMRFEVERPSVQKIELQYQAVLTNLRTHFPDREMRIPKFGVVPFYLAKSGAPLGMSGGSTTNPFVMPLLGLTLPTEVSQATGSFTLEPFRVEHVGTMKGTGRLIAIRKSGIEIAYEFTSQNSETPVRVVGRSLFRPVSGQLLRSEGTYSGPDWNGTFKISKS